MPYGTLWKFLTGYLRDQACDKLYMLACDMVFPFFYYMLSVVTNSDLLVYVRESVINNNYYLTEDRKKARACLWKHCCI